MVYLDVLIGFSLVMLVFASAVSAAQTLIKRLFAVKGRALVAPLADEIDRAWRRSPELMRLGDEALTAFRAQLTRSMTRRKGGLGQALRTLAVSEVEEIMSALDDEGRAAMRLDDAEVRAAWGSLLTDLASRWDELSERFTRAYERHTRFTIALLSAAAVMAFNVDAIRILRILSVSSEARGKLLDVVVKPPGQNPDAAAAMPATMAVQGRLSTWQRENLDELLTAGLPLGWENAPLWVSSDQSRAGVVWANRGAASAPDWAATVWLWLVRLLGLAISVGLVAQGAPSWYSVFDSVLGLKRRLSPRADSEPATRGGASGIDEELVAALDEPPALAGPAVGGAAPPAIPPSPGATPQGGRRKRK